MTIFVSGSYIFKVFDLGLLYTHYHVVEKSKQIPPPVHINIYTYLLVTFSNETRSLPSTGSPSPGAPLIPPSSVANVTRKTKSNSNN